MAYLSRRNWRIMSEKTGRLKEGIIKEPVCGNVGAHMADISLRRVEDITEVLWAATSRPPQTGIFILLPKRQLLPATSVQSPQSPSPPAPLAARGAFPTDAAPSEEKFPEEICSSPVQDSKLAARQPDRCIQSKIQRSRKTERERSRNRKHSLISMYY